MSSKMLIVIAEKEIGYTETPPNSNKTKYGQWFGLDGVAWCGMFVSWVYAQAGMPLGNIGFTKGFAGCQTAVAHFKKAGKIIDCPQAGDIVFFDWNNDGRHDHTGIFVRQIDGTTFESIEGNTSLTNQSNGGQVMRRTRKFAGALFVRP
jgi:cell wall-associated NlpC family hydrolase